MEKKVSIGSKIIYYRTKNGLNQRDFAKIMGISPPTLRNYEKDRVIPDCEFIAKLAYLLDLSVDTILN